MDVGGLQRLEGRLAQGETERDGVVRGSQVHVDPCACSFPACVVICGLERERPPAVVARVAVQTPGVQPWLRHRRGHAIEDDLVSIPPQGHAALDGGHVDGLLGFGVRDLLANVLVAQECICVTELDDQSLGRHRLVFDHEHAV